MSLFVKKMSYYQLLIYIANCTPTIIIFKNTLAVLLKVVKMAALLHNLYSRIKKICISPLSN